MKKFEVDIGKTIIPVNARSAQHAAITVLKRDHPEWLPALLRVRSRPRGRWQYWDSRQAAKLAGFKVNA